MSWWEQIAAEISAATGTTFTPKSAPSAHSGGCINSAFRLSDASRSYFIKTNRADRLDMFEAEALGLNALADSGTIRVPRAVCTGQTDGLAFIATEYVELGRARGDGWRIAGTQLATLHQTRSEHFGWDIDNTIGATPQPNRRTGDWIAFWRDQRLGHQLMLARRNGHGGHLQDLGEKLLQRFPALIDHGPQPSLMHGDLWGGNMAFDSAGNPVIYDPATYYGDREAELAMTELFGGFGADFYAAYEAMWPLDSGYRVRKQLYNLYHVLNHLNLFGGGYGSQAERMMQQLLSEC